MLHKISTYILYVHRYGVRMDQYMSDLTYVNDMDCSCARDRTASLTTLSCNIFTGAYDEVQVTSTAIFCVDTDGFPYTGYYQDTA